MKFFGTLLLSTAVAISTVSAGIYSEINGDVLGRGLPHEVSLPARSNHFLSFARRSEIIEQYYRSHPEEEDVSFEVRTGSDAEFKRSDFGVNGAKKMHRRKKSSCSAGGKKSSKSSSSAAAPKATTGNAKTSENKSTKSSSSSSSSGTYCYSDVVSGAMSMDELMSKTPASFQGLKTTIEAAAKQYQLQPELLVAIAAQESTFCTNISNGAGCFQFTDDSAWAKYGGGKSKYDNTASVWAGAAYIHDLVKARGGSLYQALRDYNGQVVNGGIASYQTDVFR